MGALAQIVVGLSYGDEGKGTTVDWLARRGGVHTVVRFNGGAQAAHHVVLPDGRHHCFAQFGSGTFAGARTHLSKFMLVNPIFARSEAATLQRNGIADPFSRLTCHEDALITTPFHVSMNRLRELARGDQRHGSCGMGIGETVADSLSHPDLAIRVRDLRDPSTLRHKLAMQQQLKILETAPLDDALHSSVDYGLILASNMVDIIVDKFRPFSEQIQIVDDAWFRRMVEQDGTVVFEGAQGVLLDETYGFQPHTTWTNCTFANALSLLDGLDVEIQKLGVIRSFYTRHGAGPFVSESADLQIEGDHNAEGPWQGSFRVGHFDLVAFCYAMDIVRPIDGLVVTWTDAHTWNTPICVAYFGNGQLPHLAPDDLNPERTAGLFRARPILRDQIPLGELLRLLELSANAPVVLTSHGPTHEHKTLHGDLLPTEDSP